MVSSARRMSFLFAPAMLMFSLAQGQMERGSKTEPVASAPNTSPVSTSVPTGSSGAPDSKGETDSGSESKTDAAGQAKGSGQKADDQESESNLPSNLPPVFQNETDPASSSTAEDREQNSSDASAEDEAETTRFFQLMKNKDYSEADDLLKEIEERAEESGDEERIKMAQRLRENLDALR